MLRRRTTIDDGRAEDGGSSFAEWELHDVLGRGGAGVVYAATHRGTGRTAAVKRAHATASAVQNHWFLREAQLAARLRHPHVVELLEWGLDEEQRPYLVYEKVDGSDLEAVADTLELSQIVRLGAELLDALGYAHDAGVVHCDVTPSNVLIDAHGTAKLIDFGLARARDESRTRRLAGGLIVSGTPGYLSPEQARGVGSPGPSSDLFGCGAVLFRVLTGYAPYDGESALEVVEHTLTIAPRPLRPREGLRVPLRLGEVVQRLLARDPEHRFASAASAAAAWLEAAERTDAYIEEGVRPIVPRNAGLQSMETVMVEPERAPVAPRDPFSTVRATPAEGIERALGRRFSPTRFERPELVRAVLDTLSPESSDALGVVSLVGPEGCGSEDILLSVRERLREAGLRVCFARGRKGGRCAPFEALASAALDAIGGSELPLRSAVQLLFDRIADAQVSDARWGADALIGGLLGVGPTGEMASAVMEAFRVSEALLEPDRRPIVVMLADADGVDEGTLSVLRALHQRPTGGVGVLLARSSKLPVADEVVVEVTAPSAAALDAAWKRWSGGVGDRPPGLTLPIDLRAFASVRAQGSVGFDEYLGATDPSTRALLQAVAIFGGDVPKRGAVDVARRASGQDVSEDVLQPALRIGSLIEVAGSCARRERWLRLPSPALHAAALESISAHLRPLLLTFAAQWLARTCLDDSAINQARIAALARDAGLPGTAAHALMEAARIERESGRTQTAVPFIEEALELAQGEAAEAIDRPRAFAWLAEASFASGLPDETRAHAAAGLAVVEPSRHALIARLRRIAADGAVYGGDPEEAVESLGMALDVLGEDGDPMELARVHALLGWTLGYRMGRNEEGIAHGRRALEVAARISAPTFRASLCGRLGANYLRAGDWDGQLETNIEDLRLSNEARDAKGIVRANVNLGVCFHNRGHLDLARKHTERARDLAERCGVAGAAQVAHNNLAMIALDDDRLADVERHAAAVLEGAERTGYRRALPETRITMGRLATRRGELEEAERHLRAAEEVGDVADLEMAHRARALLELAAGDVAKASERLDALFATPEHDPYERASSRITRASVLRAAGRAKEATEQEALADRTFASVGADAALERHRWG